MIMATKLISRSFHLTKCRMAVHKMDFDEALHEKLNKLEVKHKKHSGKRQLKTVTLSDRLENAVHKLLLPYTNGQLISAGQDLYRKLWSRQLPLEKLDIMEVYNKSALSFANKMGFDIESAPPDVADQFFKRYHSKFMGRISNRKSLWQAIEYDAFHGYLYLTFCMAPNFASLMYILNDLVKSDPTFLPKSVFSFGSGVGTDVWAVKSNWPDGVEEYYCVDSSGSMNKIAELLIQDGEENKKPFIENVYFRQFLPASHDRKYNLVISSFSLLELPSAEHRLQTVDSLWQKTSDFLLLVEPGTNAGYKAILEARDYVVDYLNTFDDVSQHGYVVAPCPHDLECPRIAEGLKTPCNFEIAYAPLSLISKGTINRYRFSYVLLKKGQRPNVEVWPRIVRPVKARHNHTACEICCSDGQLKQTVFTKSHHGYNLYKCSRYFNWGDLVPATGIQDRIKAWRNPDDVADD